MADENAKRVDHKSNGEKKRIRNLQYATRRQDLWDIYYISTVYLTGLETIFIYTKRFQISEAPLKQNEPIWNRFFKNDLKVVNTL